MLISTAITCFPYSEALLNDKVTWSCLITRMEWLSHSPQTAYAIKSKADALAECMLAAFAIQVALQTLIQMSQRFYAWLSQSAERLLNLSVPEKAQHASTMLGTWASSFFSTPDALWHFAFLLYMSIVAGLAGLELDKRRAAGRKGRSGWFW